jgi:hypothetical protein
VLLIFAPEEAERFRSFGESEHAATHVLRRQDFKEVPVRVFGDFLDASGDADAVNYCRPIFGRRTGDDFDVLEVGEELAKRLHGVSFRWFDRSTRTTEG